MAKIRITRNKNTIYLTKTTVIYPSKQNNYGKTGTIDEKKINQVL